MANWIEKILGTFGYVKDVPAQGEMLRAITEMAQGDPVTPATGRSSVEEQGNVFGRMGEFMQDFHGLDPVVPFELVEFLSRIAAVNPDLNHATTNLINLSNNGHTVNIEARTDAIMEKAHGRLNDRAQNIYPRSAGVDGLINHYIEQIAVTGAISSEDVLTPKLDGVQKVVIVPTPRIRFKLVDGEYKPFQLLRSSGEMVELNELTYHYYAYRTMENSPYAVPLYLAAVDAILTQRDMVKNIKFIVRKLGLLGIVSLSLMAPPRKAGETDKEFNDRKQRYLSAVLNDVNRNFFQGLMVKYADQTLEHHNITGDANGTSEVWNMNEEQVASGAGIDPMMIGRSYRSTESFANVVYMFMIREGNNIRRLAKRRMEETYRLDLRLQNIAIDGLAFQFNENPARDPLAEAQAQETRERAVIKKAEVGMISPDEAAQELGYESFFDVSRLSGIVQSPMSEVKAGRRYRLKYNREMGRYDFLRDRAVISLAKKSLVSEAATREIMQKWVDKYLKKISPYLKSSTVEAVEVLLGFVRRSRFSDFANADDFAAKAFAVLSPIYVDAMSSTEAQAAIKEAVKGVYEFYRIEDRAIFASVPAISFTMDAVDRRTLNFMRRIDRFYLSKYIFNESTEKSVLDFLKRRFIEGGEGIFQRTSEEALLEFKLLAQDALETMTDYEAQRIINTSVQRMRTWANIGQLDEAGFQYAEIYNPSPEAEICQFLAGKIIPVGAARQAVDELSKLTPEQFQAQLSPVTEQRINARGLDGAVRDGWGFPPYHPNCKTRLIATERKPA
jgi:hypothetical protein